MSKISLKCLLSKRIGVSLLFCILAGVGGAAILFVQDDPSNVVDSHKSLARLIEGLKNGDIASVSISHIPTNRHYPVNISSSIMDQAPVFNLVIRSPEQSALIQNFIYTLTNLNIEASKSVSDLRWGCVFHRDDGSRVVAIYFDRTGRGGVIDNGCFKFGNDNLYRWANTNFAFAFR